MRHLSIFIHDRRYSVPTLRFDLAVPPGAEAELAERILQEEPHYLAVELRDGEDLIARVERMLPRTAAPDQQGLSLED